MQKSALPLAACLLAFAVAGAHAQPLWKWRDAAGQLHISDTAPPAGTPAKNIISAPQGGPAPAPASAPVANAMAAASAPSALDKKKMAADQEKADKEKAARAETEAKNAAIRQENCTRAKGTLAGLQNGQRIARTNEKGEREFLDDAARASETKRAQEIISANCGPAPAGL